MRYQHMLALALPALAASSGLFNGNGVWLTWNVGFDEKLSVQRTPAVIDALKHTEADVMCLTEVWGGATRVKDFVGNLSSHYPYFYSNVPRDFIEGRNHSYTPPCSKGFDVLTLERCIVQNCPTSPSSCGLICLMDQVQVSIYSDCWACWVDQGILFNTKQKTLPEVANACSTDTGQPWTPYYGNLILSKFPLQPVLSGHYTVNPVVPTGYLMAAVPEIDSLAVCTHLSGDAPSALESAALLNLTRPLLHQYPNQFIMGDFNNGPAIPALGLGGVEEEAYAVFNNSGNYTEAFALVDPSCTVCANTTVVVGAGAALIDHIWVSNHAMEEIACAGHTIHGSQAYVGLVNISNFVLGEATPSPRCVESSFSDHVGVAININENRFRLGTHGRVNFCN